MSKVIISCAITGSIHTPTMSPHLPWTPDQIAEQAVGAAKVNLRGLSAATVGRRFVAYLGFDSWEDAIKAAAAIKAWDRKK